MFENFIFYEKMIFLKLNFTIIKCISKIKQNEIEKYL